MGTFFLLKMTNYPEIDEKLKNSFLKVKEHMDKLEQQIKAQNEQIQALIQRIDKTPMENKPKNEEFSHPEPYSPQTEKSSTGNDGVYSFIHSLNIHSFNSYALDMHTFKKDLEKAFSALTKQEFLTFLTIYQLQEDLNRQITYPDISNKLKLSEGCIRTYVSSIIKKKLPLTKTKANNKTILLSIPKEFVDLNLKQKLVSLFNKTDPEQMRLSDV